MRPLLSASELGYRLPSGRELWTSISFEANAGNVMAVVGPNGAGKTTLLRTLAGLLPIQCGQLTRYEMCGYVPQASQLTGNYRVREVVAMGRVSQAGWFGPLGRNDHRAVGEAINTLRLDDIADRLFPTLSGGERQLVITARALASGSRLIILDEPMAALDLGNQAQFLALARRLAKTGHCVIFSTHQPEHASAVADHVITIAGKGVSVIGGTKEVLTESSLRELYGVEIRLVDLALDSGRCFQVAVPLLHPDVGLSEYNSERS
jgi:iron complex transport system ATP-binding protein